MNWFDKLKDRWTEFKNDPENRPKLIAMASILGVMAVMAVLLIGSGLRNMSRDAANVEASELIDGQSVNAQRNAAGGIIADIDWDTVIGYDRDGNPVYGTHNMVPSVGGYDFLGAPIFKEDLVVTGQAEDGLPIYGNYSAIDEARLRGKADPDSDIDWDKIVGYDRDGNPIFASKSNNPNLIGYDLLGNPLYKGTLKVIGHTASGLPIYDYSTREVAKKQGKAAQAALKSGSSSDVSGFIKALAAKSGMSEGDIQKLLNAYLADGKLTDAEIKELAAKLGLSEDEIRALAKQYGINVESSNGANGKDGLDGLIKELAAKSGLSEDAIRDLLNNYLADGKLTDAELRELANKLGLSEDDVRNLLSKYGVNAGDTSMSGKNGANGTNGANGMDSKSLDSLVKELAAKSGLSEDEIRKLLNGYLADGKITDSEIKDLAKKLGLSEDDVRKLLEKYGGSSVDGRDGSNGGSGKNGSSGTSGTNGTNGTNGRNGATRSGTNGTNGTNGSNGVRGGNGYNGSTGSNGNSGSNGNTGLSGINGLDGLRGLMGLNGTNGTSGINGKNGTNGTTTVNTNVTDNLRNAHTIYFNSAGGSDVPDEIVYEGATSIKPQDPVRKGYRFDGWYNGTELYPFEQPISTDLHLTAHWVRESYNITYTNIEGATIALIETYTVEDEVNIPDPERDGYVFRGWTGTGLKTETKNLAIAKGTAGDLTLKANWDVLSSKVTFDWNKPAAMVEREAAGAENIEWPSVEGGLIVTYGETYGDAVIISDTIDAWPEFDTSKEIYGYYFKGWALEGNNKMVKEYSTVRITEDSTLKAQWEKSPYASYKINCYVQTVASAKRDGESASHTIKTDENPSGNFEYKGSEPGYDRVGMTAMPVPMDIEGFTSPTVQSVRVVDDGSAEVDYFYTRKQYGLTVANDDTKFDSVTGTGIYYYGDDVVISATPKLGYTIKGWLDPQGALRGQTEPLTSTTYTFPMPAATVALTPQADLLTYIIRYNANGGTGTMEDQSFKYTADLSKLLRENTFTRDGGYHFVGWALSPTGNAVYGAGNINNALKNSATTDAAANAAATGAVSVGSWTGLATSYYPGGLARNEGDVVTLYAKWARNCYTLSVARSTSTSGGNTVGLYNTNNSNATSTVYAIQSVSKSPASGRVEAGTQVTVTATPTASAQDSMYSYNASGYSASTHSSSDLSGSYKHRWKNKYAGSFASWTSSDTSKVANSTSATYKFTMPDKAMTMTASGKFGAVQRVGEQGYLTVAAYTAAGSLPESLGYRLSSVSATKTGWIDKGTAITLTANKGAAKTCPSYHYYSSILTSNPGGGSHSQGSYKYRWQVTYTPTVGNWSLSGASATSNSGGVCKFNMPANAVTATPSGSYSAAVTGKQQYKAAGTQTGYLTAIEFLSYRKGTSEPLEINIDCREGRELHADYYVGSTCTTDLFIKTVKAGRTLNHYYGYWDIQADDDGDYSMKLYYTSLDGTGTGTQTLNRHIDEDGKDIIPYTYDTMTVTGKSEWTNV